MKKVFVLVALLLAVAGIGYYVAWPLARPSVMAELKKREKAELDAYYARTYVSFSKAGPTDLLLIIHAAKGLEKINLQIELEEWRLRQMEEQEYLRAKARRAFEEYWEMRGVPKSEHYPQDSLIVAEYEDKLEDVDSVD